MVDVLLINSNLPIPAMSLNISRIPLGIAYLASFLERKGIEVKILDLAVVNFKRQKILKKALKSNPKIVGISSTTISIPEAVKIAKQVKQVTNSPIIIGGKHVTAYPNFIENFSTLFDYELVGEGETSFTNFVKNFLKGVKPKSKIIEGKTLKNLNDLPIPAYHLLDMEKYKKHVSIVMSSRGCRYNCTYCHLGKSMIRFRDPKLVVEELKFLENIYKIKNVEFHDNNFTINKKHAKKICLEIIKEKLDLSWVCQTRCDLVDKEIVNLLKRAGCDSIIFGVESLSSSTQRTIKKNLTLRTIKKSVALSKEANLKVRILLMIGLPMETKNDFDNSIRILSELNPDHVGVSFSIPYPGTKFFDFAVKNGFDKDVWNKYAKGEILYPPFFLNPKIKRIYYSFYVSKILLHFPSVYLIYFLLINNIKILFPTLPDKIMKSFMPIIPTVLFSARKIHETFNKFLSI